MRRLTTYIYRYRKQYLWGALCLLATATVQMSIPLLIRKAVTAIGEQAGYSVLSRYVLIIIGFAIAMGIIRSFSRILILNAARNVESSLRDDLFAHLQRLSPEYYQKHRTGDLMSRLVNDLNAVRNAVGNGALNVINTPLYYAYAIPFMVAIDPGLTMIMILPYFSILWVIKTYRQRIREMSTGVQEAMGEMSSLVQENLSGRELVKNYVLGDRQVDEFLEVNQKYKERSLALARTRTFLSQIIRGVAGFSTLVVIWYGGAQVTTGKLTIADLVAFLAYLYILSGPSTRLGRIWSLMIRARASMDRIEEVFLTEPKITVTGKASNIRKAEGAIDFRNICFSYGAGGNGTPILKDISFAVKKGLTLGIVGRTGAGKSTLVSLIPRLYDVTEGEILFDGQDIRTVPLPLLRRSIGFVSQDPFLFSTTLSRNIKFGSPEVSEDAIAQAASLAQLGEDLKDFPLGYDTPIGERGLTLSGGQKQRTAIARALILNPEILILDDALSSVDFRTEQEILAELKTILKQRTSIIISNRVSVLKDADEILVLDTGEIVERGTHPSLLARGGVYTDLFHRQELSEELERY